MSVAYERLIQHLQDHEFRYHAEYERELIVADFGGKSVIQCRIRLPGDPAVLDVAAG